MSEIMVEIDGIAGESALEGHEDQIECISMRHAIDLPVVSRGAMRTEGASRHGAIEFTHSIDKASPGLRLATASGANLGKVVVTRMRMLGGQSRPAEVITLGNAYAVRVDTDTAVVGGEPAEEPMERFSIEYSDITWDCKYYVDGDEKGSVQGSWSTAMQSVDV